MQIKISRIFVDDQDKALDFYTNKLGFQKSADNTQGPYRWLTVASPEEPGGTQLQLELNSNPAAKTFQQAMYSQNQPAAMFYTNDLQGDYDRLVGQGVKFTVPATKEAWGSMATLDDGCGNLIQITQLAWG